MALAYHTRRTLANAMQRALHSPAQLAALLVMLLYTVINLAVVIGLAAAPLPRPLRTFLAEQIPGGVVAQLAGIHGTLVIVLVSLAASAAFENPLLQFGQADIDQLFPSPIPGWRLMLGRVLMNHLRAFAAGLFLWGLAVVPLLRVSGLEVWPVGAVALVGLTCTFAMIDQLFGAALLWLSGHSATRWLTRMGLVLVGLAVLGGLVALIMWMTTGSWVLVGTLAAGIGTVLARLALPIGLAVDLLLLPANPQKNWQLALSGLVIFDVVSASLIVMLSGRHLRELAFTTREQRNLIQRAWRLSRGRPARFAALVWNPEWLNDDQHLQETGIPVFGRAAWVIVWVRLTQMWRNLGRTMLALVVLGVGPLALVVVNQVDSLGSRVAALIFSISLATQVFHELREHVQHADADLALPVPRSRLLLASLLAHIPLYWAGGLVLLVGIAILQPGTPWHELVLLAFWQPMIAFALLALRGAVLFVFPAAALPGKRDPLQYALVALLNAIVTGGLLMVALLPVWALIALARFVRVNPILLWVVLFGGAIILVGVGWLAIWWAYRRYEPGE